MEHQDQNLRSRGGNDHHPHFAQHRVQLSKHWLKGLGATSLIFQLSKACTQPYKAAFYMLLYLT